MPLSLYATFQFCLAVSAKLLTVLDWFKWGKFDSLAESSFYSCIPEQAKQKLSLW